MQKILTIVDGPGMSEISYKNTPPATISEIPQTTKRTLRISRTAKMFARTFIKEGEMKGSKRTKENKS
jgi:hypothetical protein